MSEEKDMFDSIYDLSFEMTMEKPRKRPNVWVCANPACSISPCWATSNDRSEVPNASDCLEKRPDFMFVQVKPMTGRCIQKEDDVVVIDVEPEHKLLEQGR